MIPRRKVHILKDEFRRLMRMWHKKNNGLLEYVKKWEDLFANYIGVKYAVAVSSGRVGMELILRSLELDKGDEVIIPAYTLKDLIGIIQSLGLTVIPADINPNTFNINHNSIAERIRERTRVILTTHIFGTPCQIDKILEVARRKSIFVIEDCAHSVGAEFKGRKTGSFGDASFFSFDTIKPINTYGGGMVVTNDINLANKIRKRVAYNKNRLGIPLKRIIAAYLETYLLPNPISFPILYLLASKCWHKKMFYFYRTMQKLSASGRPFSGFQALIGLEKLKSLGKRIAERQTQANLLRSLLSKSFRPQKIGEEMSPNYYFFVVLLPDNFDIWKVRKFLLMRGIDAGIGAEITDDCGSILEQIDCPNATEVFQHAIQLPLHEGMSESHIEYIVKILREFFNDNKDFCDNLTLLSL